jgi:Uma2 family endonuclease
MATAMQPVILTYDDLDFIPQERLGDRHELFDGGVGRDAVTDSGPPDRQRKRFRAAAGAVRPMGLGLVLAVPIDVRLAPSVVMIPDLIFIAQERLGIVGPKAIEGPPDLVVEILSPSTRRRDQGRKREIYARFGVPEYWLLGPGTRSMTALGCARRGLPTAAGGGRHHPVDRGARPRGPCLGVVRGHLSEELTPASATWPKTERARTQRSVRLSLTWLEKRPTTIVATTIAARPTLSSGVEARRGVRAGSLKYITATTRR